MTTARLVPLPIHSALEMLGGLTLMVAPFFLGVSTAAAVIGVTVGALVVGLALQAVETNSREVIALSAHHAADYGLALGLAGAAAVVGLAGDGVAATFFALMAAAQLLLNTTTRYSKRG
jgi:hypothetical protein